MEKVAQIPIFFAANFEELLANPTTRSQLEKEALPAYLSRQRWYRSKTRKIIQARIETWARFPLEAINHSFFAAVTASFENGETESYALPLATLAEEDADNEVGTVLCRLRSHEGKQVLVDALGIAIFRAALLKALLNGAQMPFGNGVLKAHPFSEEYQILTLNRENHSERVDGEQSNTSMVFSSGHFLKLYRLLEEGAHPEPETLRLLERERYPHAPSFRSVLEWERPGKLPVTWALAQKRIDARQTGWDYLLERLKPLLETAQDSNPGNISLPEDLVDWIRLLGRRTAGLHLALAVRHDETFSPEPVSIEDILISRDSAAQLLNGCIALLNDRNDRAPEELKALRGVLLKLEQLETTLASAGEDLGSKIRIHGDLHLGQILKGSADIWFIDFEGEPGRPLLEKRNKHSPLRDVAGMLRSFDYATHVALRALASDSLPQNKMGASFALDSLFIQGYFDILGGSDLLPSEETGRQALLDFFVMEKAIYELHYELNNRPDWVEIPLRGLMAAATS